MDRRPITENTLFYGDNLKILREYIISECIDLIYLDPPFNSSRNYNVLFKDESGIDSESQIIAFEDTWHWNHTTEQTYHDLQTQAPDNVSQMITALRGFVGTNQMMAYLVMMTARLVELHRVLKPTGSLYLHCDPTASHYLKIIMDTIFGVQNFLSEITWKRTHSHGNVGRNYGAICDIILTYTKSKTYIWNQVYTPFSDEYIADTFKYHDPDGRKWQSVSLRNPSFRPNLHFPYIASNNITYQPHHNGWSCDIERLQKYDREGRLHFPAKPTGALRLKMYLDESPGIKLQNLWDDIPALGSHAAERLGYPTQKPLALLERIIETSSNPGDIILDPFCGCGTAIAAAQKLDRKWAGIDITHLSIALQKYRMEAMFPGIQFKVVGEPEDIGAAKKLAHDDRYQFQWWALSLIKAKPLGAQEGSKVGKKGSDKGIDGIINFVDDATNKPKRVIVQVKSGHVKSGDIRDLVGTVKREEAPIGIFITLEEPSKDMVKEALSAGYYHSPGWNQDYPAIQILTIADLLDRSKNIVVKMPPQHGTFKEAQKAKREDSATQLSMLTLPGEDLPELSQDEEDDLELAE